MIRLLLDVKVVPPQECPADAVFVERPGERGLLLLRQGQTRQSAIAAVGAALPDATPVEVARLVGQYLPDALDIDAMLEEVTRRHYLPALIRIGWGRVLFPILGAASSWGMLQLHWSGAL